MLESSTSKADVYARTKSSTVTEKINEILDKRKEHAPLLKRRIEDLKAAMAAIKKIQDLKDSVVDEKGQLRADSPYFKVFADNMELLGALGGVNLSSSLLEDMKKLKEGYEHLLKRFEREFINIAVVGPARQGKSLFLQAVSGLDSKCIPAFDGDHCTGASSTVENAENEKVKVYLTYKSEKDILTEANGYLEIISGGTESVASLDSLSQYTEERLRQLQSNVKTNKADAAAKAAIFYKRYVENYAEWKSLINKAADWMYDEEQIMTYVAQHNGFDEEDPRRENYFKFVGVESARIIKKFSYHDCGKIKLVDTEGLGTTTTDTERKMFETIEKDSDAVIFFRFPAARTGGTPTSDEVEIFDRLRGKFASKKMEKWFAFLLNHCRESKKWHDNLSNCKTYKTALDRNDFLPTIMNEIIDVADPVEVRENFLIPLLESLSGSLGEIDQMFLDELEPLASKTWRSYSALCKSVDGLVKFSAGANSINEIWKLYDKTYNSSLTVKLRKLNQEYGAKREEECEILSARIEKITGFGIDDGFIMDEVPSQETVQEYIDTHGRATIADVYMHFLNTARSNITQKYIEIDTSLKELIVQFKDTIAEVLMEAGELSKILPPSGDREKYEWLKEFADEYLEPYAQIRRAFHFLYEFDFSVRGGLMHKVRIGLYEISLANPNVLNVNFGSGEASVVVFKMERALRDVREKLKYSLEDFYIAPNEAMYAICDEFFERVTTSEGVCDEWRELYSSYAGRIWSEQLMHTQKTGQTIAGWKADIETLRKYNNKDTFSLKLADDALRATT